MNQGTPTVKGLEFVETVVVKNRDLANGRLFSNIEDAKRWLLAEEDE